MAGLAHVNDSYWSDPYELALGGLGSHEVSSMTMENQRLLTAPSTSADVLRVLMVTPFYGDGGGVGNVSKELTEKLRDKNIFVEVLHWWPNFNNPIFIDATQTRIPLASVGDLLQSDRHYDVLHFQSAAFSDRLNGGLSKIVSRYEVPIVYTIHSLAAYHGEIMNNVEGMRNNMQDQADLMERSARVVLLTEDLIEIAARHHPEHAERFLVTPNGTNLPSYTEEDRVERERLRALYNPDNQAKILLYVGRISQEKGIYELVEAFPLLKKRHGELKLVIAGNKPQDPNIRKIRDDFSRASLIEGVDYDFAGWVDGLTKSALYELADFVVMPSYYEHMPLTALEAMARRKPVIITDIESLRLTFATHHPDQRCVLPIRQIKDAQAVVEAVSYALENPGEIGELVERAYQQVVDRYNWDAVVDSWIGLYKAQLSEARAARLGSEEDARQRQAHEERQRRQAEGRALATQGVQAAAEGAPADAVRLLQQARRLCPEDPQLRQKLAAACERQVHQLRGELVIELCDGPRIARLQHVAEELRLLRVDAQQSLPRAEVSAVMPVFLRSATRDKGLGFLVEAIDSVIGQGFSRPYELIIIDDHSEIDVPGFIVSRYSDLVLEIRGEAGELRYRCDALGSLPRKWIKIIAKQKNSGNDVAPRNLGILAALYSGSRYVTQIDSDDRMTPDRLQISYAYLERNPETDLVHGRHRCIDETGAIRTGGPVDGWFNFARRFTFGMDQNDPRNEGRSKRNSKREVEILAKDNWVHGGTVMYRSNVVWRVGLENLTPMQRYGADHAFWQKVSKVANLDYLSTILTEHRLHSGSMTQGGR